MVSRPLERSVKATEGFESAAFVTTTATARASASGDARNLRRAGVVSKRLSMSTSVPRGRAAISLESLPP